MKNPDRLEAVIRKNLELFPVKIKNDKIVDPVRILNGRGGNPQDFEDLNIDIFPGLVFAVCYKHLSDSVTQQMKESLT